MLTRDLPSQTIPHLRLHDTVFQALQLMNDYHVAHLPVKNENEYAGIISLDQLLHCEDETIAIENLQIQFSKPSVKDDEHFLKAIQVAVQNGLSIVPVVDDENEMVGVVSYHDLLKYASEFMSLQEPGGLIVIEMENKAYSFSEINRVIESNDAQITQLNTVTNPQTGLMQVTIKVNKLEIADIVASLQRFEYNVKYYFGEELYENELRSNYDNLMNYLKI